MEKRFLTGFGAFDTKIKTAEQYKTIELKDVARLCRNPRTEEKQNAQWAIFSTYVEHDARSHDRQREDGHFVALAGDIDTGNKTMVEVVNAIKEICGSVHFLVYSTSGATQENKKWRFLVPVRHNLPGYRYSEIQRAFFDC